jgi:hypothetical protein
MSSILTYAKGHPTRIDIQREGDYFVVTTPTWILKSWISRSQTLACAKRIETVRENLAVIFKDRLSENLVPHKNTIHPLFEQSEKTPLQILILKNQGSFSKYTKENLGKVHYGGGYWSSGKNEVVILDHQNVEETLKVLSHELTHYFIHRSFPQIPLWLNEGLSEYISASPMRWGKFKEAYPHEIHLDQIVKAFEADALIPIYRLISYCSYLGGHQLKLQYAESWGLVYFFFHGLKGKYALRFMDYLESLKRNPQTQLDDFFDLGEIEAVWVRELRKIKVGKVKVRSEMNLFQSEEE